jgi:hypothetical protein
MFWMVSREKAHLPPGPFGQGEKISQKGRGHFPVGTLPPFESGPTRSLRVEGTAPGSDDGAIDLGMKLQAAGRFPDTEGLEGARGRAGKEPGAGGKIEAVPVPLEGFEAVGTPPKQGIKTPLLRQGDRLQAPLPPGVQPHFSARDLGQQLPAKTDAEQGDLSLQPIPHPSLHLEQKGKADGLLHPHLAAEHDGAGQARKLRRRLAGKGAPASVGNTPLLEQFSEDAWRNPGIVLNEKDHDSL